MRFHLFELYNESERNLNSLVFFILFIIYTGYRSQICKNKTQGS